MGVEPLTSGLALKVKVALKAVRCTPIVSSNYMVLRYSAAVSQKMLVVYVWQPFQSFMFFVIHKLYAIKNMVY